MKSTTKKRKSLASELIRTYLVLTFAVLVGFIAIQWLMNSQYALYMPASDVPAFIQSLEKSENDHIDAAVIRNNLGRGAAAAIYDEEGRLLAGEMRPDLPQTVKELRLIQSYNSSTAKTAVKFKDKNGQFKQLVVVEDYADQGKNGFILLDEDGNIVETSFDLTVKNYTTYELAFLTGNSESSYELYREDYLRNDGQKRSVVISIPRIPEDSYVQIFDSFQYAWIAMITLYVLLVIISIMRLNEKSKKLLSPLSVAIDGLMSGSTTAPIEYEGPGEFVDIYGRFNALTRQLTQTKKEKEHLDAEKKQMLTGISHDLRTPVTVIAGYAKALHDHVVPEEHIQQYLETIELKSAQLSRLIDNFFAYSLIEHPDLLFEPVPQDLAEFTRAYFAEKYQEIDLAGFNLETDIPEEKIIVSLDIAQVHRVFDNLLGNAVSHNPPGTTITVTLKDDADHASLIVGNDGSEIPESLAKAVFSPFVVNDDARGKSGHSGLGLAITAKIMEKHGGTATLVIPPPAGCATAFLLQFPKDKPEKGNSAG